MGFQALRGMQPFHAQRAWKPIVRILPEPIVRISADDPSQHPSWFLSTIRQIAAADPDRIALRTAGYRRTYCELLDEGDRIAGALARRGIGPGSFVPVVGSRGPKVIPALIGVMVAGAAVVPMDAAEPPWVRGTCCMTRPLRW